ncbi:MAG TPA: HupE/UreJ family protein [Burkholderiales bacterium]|nr:HupE/UreJ family protein [Burkholderiales bacterium]
MRFLLALLFLGTAHAHELQPGFLELTEKDAGRYQVFWKQPPSGGAPLRLTPVFPAACQQASEAGGTMDAGAWLYRTTIQCQPALAGQTIAIEGLEAFSTDVLVRMQHASGAVETHLLKPERSSITLGSGTAPPRAALTYLILGIEHIALGVDHLLFVLGLLLIVRRRWVLVKTITAFTVSHSIALAAATFSVVSVPAAPLNAAIALSILFLGPEIVRTWRGESSFTIRHPWAVAFLFGLLHGFGFASGLTGLGLPREEIPLALLLFNVGVEIGQLAFVLLVLALERAFRVLEMRWPAPALRFPGYLVGTLGAFWTLSTVTAMVAR